MITIKAPASKSCAQRAILCATLAKGQSVVRGIGGSDDVKAAIGACRSLGAEIEQVGDDLHISGAEKLQAGTIDVGESGLLARLITPIAALVTGDSQIIGCGTINSRPMTSLVDAVAQMGVTISSTGDYLPLIISGTLAPPSVIRIDGSGGSQVLSGLLMALPLTKSDTIVEVENLQSRPYIDLTISILTQFGIEVENIEYSTFQIRGNQRYQPVNYTVEGDWSGASYFLVADAIAGGRGAITVTGLDNNSTQADRAILTALEEANGLTAFEFDATHCPDLFPSLVALASHCKGESRIIGTSRLAHKESARDLVLQKEWSKFGVKIDLSTANTMTIKGLGDSQITQFAPIDPHGDHRIAMAAAIMGCGVRIDSQEVVAKSFPEFWDEQRKIEHLLNTISK